MASVGREGGIGTVLVGASHFRLRSRRPGKLAFPLVVFGANAITVYVASILVKVYILQGWQHRTASGASVSIRQAVLNYLSAAYGAVAGGWIFTIGFIVFWWLVLLYLYQKRIFVRV